MSDEDEFKVRYVAKGGYGPYAAYVVWEDEEEEIAVGTNRDSDSPVRVQWTPDEDIWKEID